MRTASSSREDSVARRRRRSPRRVLEATRSATPYKKVRALQAVIWSSLSAATSNTCCVASSASGGDSPRRRKSRQTEIDVLFDELGKCGSLSVCSG